MKPRRLHRSRIILALIALAASLAMPAASVAAGGPVTRYVDDDGHAGRAGCDGRISVPTRLQPAIDASGRGDTVRVCPGTYVGKVFIRSDNDGLRLVAATDTRPVLKPPRSRAGAVLVVRDAQGVVIEGLRFRPHGGRGTCTEVREFIRVLGNTRVRIVDNVFAGIEPYTSSCNRYLRAVFAWWPRTGQRVDFSRNVIRDYGGAAVLMGWFDDDRSPDASSLRVVDNRFVSQHRLASNWGIAVSAWVVDGALITDNVLSVDPRSRREVGLAEVYADDTVIRRNVATGVARGIAVAPQGDIGARIEDNILRGRTLGADDNTFDLLGISLQNDHHHVARNLVTGFTQGGILNWANGVVVEDNDFRGNGGLDCSSPDHDDLFDVWQRNLGDESDPAGLCSPP